MQHTNDIRDEDVGLVCGLTAIGAPFGANGAPDPSGYEAGPIGVVV